MDLTQDHAGTAWGHWLSQFDGKPRLEALVKALLKPADGIQGALKALYEERWLDTAVGKQLDGIGEIVGLSRVIDEALFTAFFGFVGQPAIGGFGQARIRRGYENALVGSTTLQDPEYRKLLYWKIALNNGHGTAPEIVTALKPIFDVERVIVEDAGNAKIRITADEVVVTTALGGAPIRLANVNKTINIATTGAGGMDTGASPVSTWVAIYLIYNPSTGVSALLGYNTGSNVAPEVYAGANMPAGYTASALVSIVATNPSGQLKPFIQRDRKVAFAGIGVFNSTTDASSFQPISLVGAVPPNAKTAGGYGDASITVGGVTNFAFASDATGIGNQTFNSSCSVAYGHSLVWTDIPLATQQTIYIYRAATLNGAGTRQYTAYCSSYTF
ncbi:DUF2612 domain-containing protein [Cupriavidus gilardii]|uniref:DUF2612 domain-containing protein n=1 Tax=Cupriavidus gilardii TaxID=82541 RepID=UPI0021BF3568|nr:DUF2612 domain-containing protein [Cupriavidus gilardii]MCT9127503.1 DUF2612 domain-containing protein [Cupriavidus gilardii]